MRDDKTLCREGESEEKIEVMRDDKILCRVRKKSRSCGMIRLCVERERESEREKDRGHAR